MYKQLTENPDMEEKEIQKYHETLSNENINLVQENSESELKELLDIVNAAGDSSVEEQAIEEVKASLKQFGITVPEGKHDLKTIQSLLQQALQVQTNLPSKPASEQPKLLAQSKTVKTNKVEKKQQAKSVAGKKHSLVDISSQRVETLQQLDADIVELEKTVTDDKRTIEVLKERLEIAEDSLKNDKKLLENKKMLKAKKSEQ